MPAKPRKLARDCATRHNASSVASSLSNQPSALYILPATMSPAEGSIGLQMATQRNFHHPYEPYEIQKQFMSAVYECIEAGKVGIFESPTGEAF